MLRKLNQFIDNPIKTTMDEIERIPNNAARAGRNINGFFQNPRETTIQEILRIPNNFKNFARQIDEITNIIKPYQDYLRNQAFGRWKKLPNQLIDLLQPHYKVNLRDIRYAECIDTLHGQCITIGDEIFFTYSIDPINNKNDLRILLHELEHVTQYHAHGGITAFVIKYIFNGAIEIGKHKDINVIKIHDAIQLEKDAEAKANNLINTIWHELNPNIRLR